MGAIDSGCDLLRPGIQGRDGICEIENTGCGIQRDIVRPRLKSSDHILNLSVLDDDDRIAVHVANVDGIVSSDGDSSWLLQSDVRPLLDKGSILIENLNTRFLRFRLFVNHEQSSLRIQRERMWDVELPVLRSFCAPCLDKLSILGEFYDPGVTALAVGYKKIAIPRYGDIAGAVKQVGGVIVTGRSLFPDGHQLLSLDRKLVHHVIGPIRNPQKSFTIEIDAVCFLEQAVAPALLKFSVTVVDKDWGIGRPEQDDHSLAVCSYRSRQVPDGLPGRRRAKYRDFILIIRCLRQNCGM